MTTIEQDPVFRGPRVAGRLAALHRLYQDLSIPVKWAVFPSDDEVDRHDQNKQARDTALDIALTEAAKGVEIFTELQADMTWIGGLTSFFDPAKVDLHAALGTLDSQDEELAAARIINAGDLVNLPAVATRGAHACPSERATLMGFIAFLNAQADADAESGVLSSALAWSQSSMCSISQAVLEAGALADEHDMVQSGASACSYFCDSASF